jgi:protein-S-isoprenylcysteine O-methyltransferase Ste14
MDIDKIIILTNLGIIVVFLGVKIIKNVIKGINIIGVRKEKNKFMSILIVFSSILLLLLWISYIFDLTIIKNLLSFFSAAQSTAIKWVAVSLISLATFIEILAGITIKDSFRIHSPQEKENIRLISHGIYRIIRNPIILGVFCYAAGIMILNPGLLSLTMFIMVIIGYNYKVDTEAKELEKRFAGAWYNYCKNTGKYFPKLFKP